MDVLDTDELGSIIIFLNILNQRDQKITLYT